MKIEHFLFPSVFPKLRIRASEGHFQCVHTIRFSEPTLKTERVNRPRDTQNFNDLALAKMTLG